LNIVAAETRAKQFIESAPDHGRKRNLPTQFPSFGERTRRNPPINEPVQEALAACDRKEELQDVPKEALGSAAWGCPPTRAVNGTQDAARSVSQQTEKSLQDPLGP
jgi:hypothetical protein